MKSKMAANIITGLLLPAGTWPRSGWREPCFCGAEGNDRTLILEQRGDEDVHGNIQS